MDDNGIVINVGSDTNSYAAKNLNITFDTKVANLQYEQATINAQNAANAATTATVNADAATTAAETATENAITATTNVNNVINDAETAITNAENATQNATTAANTATTAAALANQKATVAQTATDAAITATANANAATDAATTAANTATTAASNANASVDAATTAANTATTATTNVNNAVHDAEIAITNAKNATQNATTSANTANTAAALANQKATVAQTATDAATTAANTATTAATTAINSVMMYDCSQKGTVTFDTLDLAIAAVPLAYQKGGLHIKFVDTASNKYNTYFLTTPTWSISTSDWQYSNENIKYAKNGTGSTVAKGKVVYINSSTGGNPIFQIATNADYAIASRAWGVTMDSINNNAVGRVIHFGMLENLDTSAYTAGTELWLGVNGAFTNVRPVSPAFQTSIGMVIIQHATVGSIFVNMRYVNIEGVRSQNPNTSPSSKLLDDELVKVSSELNAAKSNLILEWKTDSTTTRNQIPTNIRKKGLVISYKGPNITENGGWITEQYIADDVPINNLWGNDLRWTPWNYQKQINAIKSDLAFDYKVTYNSNFGTMLYAIPKDIRKQFLVVAYTDSNGNLTRIIRTTPFSQATDGDAGWYLSTAWETLVSRKEFSEVQKNILLMNKTNFVCNILNNSTTGVFDKTTNTLYFSSSTNPTKLKGLNVSFGIGNKDAIDRMNLLYKIGVKPSIQMTVETSNITTINGIFFYNTNRQLTTALFQSKNIAGKTVYYADDLNIPDNLWYISFYLYSNVKTTSGEEASLRILSADIYYPNEMHNNYFINGDGENLIESHIIFDTDNDTATNKYCKIIDDRTALITVPKGTNLSSRDIVIPLKSFPKPLSFGSIGENKLIRFKSNGDSSFGELNFAEISAEINAKLIDISKFSNQISFKDSEVLYLSTLQNTNNYYGQYAYNKVAIRCGLTPNVVLEEDFVCIIQADILDFKQTDNLNDELDRIRTDLSDMKKSIGTYSANFHNPYCGIVGKSENVILSDKNTVKIDDGISEDGEYVDLLIAASRVRSHNIEEPEYSVQFITNKNTEDSIGITADVLSETDIKIQSATVSYNEIYNGIVTVNFKLLKQTSDIRFVKLRCTFTTSLSNGISLSVSDCSVKNLSKSSSMSETLYNLQYGNRPMIIQSQNGKKFRLIVSDDGTLSTAPSVPSKMMVMSHSWGLIPYNPSSGWYGNWGLAASKESLDMVHQIETQGKSFNPEFSSFYYRFATFAMRFKEGASWFEQFDCSNLDFDSIFICCFAAGPTDGDWTGFAEALYDCVTNYVCRGKSNIPVYISYGGGDRSEIEKAAGLFGTQLIDTSDVYTSNGRGWPWLMPAKPDGTRPIKAMSLPEGANQEDYILNSLLGHPGNWGFYTVAKNLSNQIHEDFSIQNDNPIVMNFDTYKIQPEISKWVDPNYPYNF